MGKGLQRVLKVYGRMKVGNVYWIWDYAQNKARLEKEMTKEEVRASEEAKWKIILANKT